MKILSRIRLFVFGKLKRASRFRRQLLSWQIKTARKDLCHFENRNRLSSLFKEAYYPSFKSFFLVLLLPLVFLVLSQLEQIASWLRIDKLSIWNSRPLSAHGNGYQDLIAIHAGIGIIIFALVIFVAESLRDDEAKEKARVLLKVSFLFPLAVAEILTFFTFVWGTADFWTVIPVITIGIFTIISLSRIVLVLLSRYRFAQMTSELLSERLKRSLHAAVDERIGNNILFSKLNSQDLKLTFNPYLNDNQSDYYIFNARQFGIVSDINLAELREIADFIDREARRNGFSFSDGESSTGEATEEGSVQNSGSSHLIKNDLRYLLKTYHQIISEDSRALIGIHKTLLNGTENLSRLNLQIVNAFTIASKDNFDEEMQSEFSGIADQFIAAIDGRKLGKVKELSTLYLKLAEVFLELITDCGGGYSSDTARTERGSLFSGWKQVKWLSDDTRNFFRVAMRGKDLEVIQEVAYLPMAIAIRAIRKNDHYLFQEFIEFGRLIYAAASQEEEGSETRTFLMDRSWRYPKEIATYYVEMKLNANNLDDERVNSLGDFGIHIFILFQHLLKQAFEYRDFDSFANFLGEAEELFSDFKPSHSMPNVRLLEVQLQGQDLVDDQRKALNERLVKQGRLEDLENKISTRRKQMLFGLASWILDQYAKNPMDEEVGKFYIKIQAAFPADIVQLTDIFLKTHDFEVEHFWGWGWWELRVDGEVTTIQILEKLETFYAIKALSLLSSQTEDSARAVMLPHSRDLAYLVDGSRDLMKTLNDVMENPGKWRFVLSECALNRVDLLKEMLLKASEAQVQEELQSKREQDPSPESVREFKDGVISGFFETVVLRNVFAYCNAFSNDMDKPTDITETRFGINTVDDKGPFLTQSHVIYVDWGRNYGRNFALNENSYLLNEIDKECEVGTTIDTTLLKFEDPRDVLIVGINVGFGYDFRGFGQVVTKWSNDAKQLEMNGWAGCYRTNGIDIPLFETYAPKLEKQIYILNRRKLGRLVQLPPQNDREDIALVRDLFYLDVSAFSQDEEMVDEFVNTPPDWLKDKGDAEHQRKYLQERVRIKIFERFRYDPEGFEGYKLLPPDDPIDDAL